MDGPTIDDRPLHRVRQSAHFAEMSVDFVETTAGGRAGVLLVLTECYCSLDAISERGGGGGREGGEEGRREGGEEGKDLKIISQVMYRLQWKMCPY